MILTVTLNPMLDKTVELDTLRPGSIHRARGVHAIVGGKGVNVARQLTRFGTAALATGCLGGEVGNLLQRLMTEEGIPHDFYPIAGMTREGVTYRESDGQWTAMFEPPHPVTAAEAEGILAHVLALMGRADRVVCSGSSPCPETVELFAAVIRAARKRGCMSWLDSYGEAFRRALEAGPTVVQCNRAEIEESLMRPVRTEDDLREVFRFLLSRGVERAILTDGAGRAYANEGEGFWSAAPPAVPVVNPTGSGDSLAAGVLWQLERGVSFGEAFRFGIAAGAANAARWEVATSSAGEVTELLPAVQYELKR